MKCRRPREKTKPYVWIVLIILLCLIASASNSVEKRKNAVDDQFSGMEQFIDHNSGR